MNLAIHDVRRHLPGFVGTGLGLGLLFSVVLAMGGIYAGLVDDAVLLPRALGADLWIVSRHAPGPFADTSRIDPQVEARVASLPGVTSARAFTYQVLQREHAGRSLRLALVGLSWPDDRGESLPLVAGRALAQGRGELIADLSLGLAIGERVSLGGDDFHVVGLAHHALGSGGDGAAFVSVGDSQRILAETPDAALLQERQRRLERLRGTDLSRTSPSLEGLAVDDRVRPPALPSPSISAVLATVAAPERVGEVVRVVRSWGDVTTYTQAEQEGLLLQGVVSKARLQIGLFTGILTITSAVVVAMVLYTMTVSKTHDIAVLGLLGARRRRIGLMVLQQSWLLGAIGYGVARLLGAAVFPSFPRRVLLTDEILTIAPVLVLLVTTLASLLGVVHALRVEPGRVLEG